MNRPTSRTTWLGPSTLALLACLWACSYALSPAATWGSELQTQGTPTPAEGTLNPAPVARAAPIAESVVVDDRRGTRRAEPHVIDGDAYAPLPPGPRERRGSLGPLKPGALDPAAIHAEPVDAEAMEAEALRLRDARGSIVPGDWGAFEGTNAPRPRKWVDRGTRGEPLHSATDPPSRAAPWSPQRPPRPSYWTHDVRAVAPDARPSLIDVLRNAAIQFDATANRLEAFELYEQADAVRRTAQELRTKARAVRQEEGMRQEAGMRLGEAVRRAENDATPSPGDAPASRSER